MSNFDNSPRISVILVTWNSSIHLPHCLNCLSAQITTDFEVIIVDNGSTDGFINELENRWPNLTILVEHLETNLGFATANNIGARLARGKWLALLNTDAFPEPDWLEKLLQTAENNPEYSFFASRLIQANAPHLLDGGGDCYHVSGLAWKEFIGYPASQFGFNSKEVFSPCAAAAMYSRLAFLDVGGFDEDFFSYFEDVDLGFRLRLRSHRCLYVANAVVHHVGSATFGDRSNFAYYHSHRNLVWTFVQNMPTAMLWKHLPAHLIANLIYPVYYSLQSPGKSIWRGKWDAIKGLKRAFQKRRKIQSRRLVSMDELERVMEHGVMKPYTLGAYLRQILKKK